MSLDEYSAPVFDDDFEPGDFSLEELGKLEALANAEEIIPPDEQVLVEETILSPLELIPFAIANRQHLQIEYMNKRGEIKLYVGEPYEVGGAGSHPAGYLWMHDINADQIKSFFLSNIMDVQLLETYFVPRY